MWCSSLMFVVFSCFPGMSCFGSCLLCFHVSRNVMFCFLFVLFSCLPGMSFSVVFSCFLECRFLLFVCLFFMFPGMSCSASCCVFMLPRNVIFWFMFVAFSCFHECHVLVLVWCVFMFPRNVVFWFMFVVFSCFPGMSCSGSCLLCFRVSQECCVLVHIWRKAVLLCLQNLLSPCREPQPKAWRGGGSWTGEQLSVETSGAFFGVQCRPVFTHSGKPRCTPPSLFIWRWSTSL